jgi:hypothetical protein
MFGCLHLKCKFLFIGSINIFCWLENCTTELNAKPETCLKGLKWNVCTGVAEKKWNSITQNPTLKINVGAQNVSHESLLFSCAINSTCSYDLKSIEGVELKCFWSQRTKFFIFFCANWFKMPKMDRRRNENLKSDLRDSKPTQLNTKICVCVCVCVCETELIIGKKLLKKKPVSTTKHLKHSKCLKLCAISY